MKRASSELVRKVRKYAKRHKGVYAPILHPEFENLDTHHGHDRWNIIKASLVGVERGSVLDIGSHWGYFAHRFEDEGFRVIAAEQDQGFLYFLREIRDLCGKSFEIMAGSPFDLDEADYDVVLALCIFHHYLKDEEGFEKLDGFLDILETKVVYLQAHAENAPQMKGAFRPFGPVEFSEFVARKTGLSRIEHIGETDNRPIYKIF